MPVFFQHQINENTRLGVWKIEETETFFKGNVPVHREVTHPHKRLQHLAGRFLLQYLFPAFPYDLVRVADTRKPFLPDEQFHFSISHCGDYAAAIVSTDKRVGVDIEIPVEKILRVKDKFLSEEEKKIFNTQYSILNTQLATTLWSCKEAVFKWYGDGSVDFKRHIQLQRIHQGTETVDCLFAKNDTSLQLHYRHFDQLVLAWVMS
ncbi:MAG TPA: 4'-phosphopantetheinyl transferase superfamily protein [Chitinophagaceae bacterium]